MSLNKVCSITVWQRCIDFFPRNTKTIESNVAYFRVWQIREDFQALSRLAFHPIFFPLHPTTSNVIPRLYNSTRAIGGHRREGGGHFVNGGWVFSTCRINYTKAKCDYILYIFDIDEAERNEISLNGWCDTYLHFFCFWFCFDHTVASACQRNRLWYTFFFYFRHRLQVGLERQHTISTFVYLYASAFLPSWQKSTVLSLE